MKSVRRVCACGVIGAVLLVSGGCHGFHAHWHGGGGHWDVHGCGGDGGLFVLGILGIAAGIHAIVEACRCR
jgi:hypothetical protein